jgi:hypothetical protein
VKKETVTKSRQSASMATKQDDNTLQSLELSEGQLEVHFRRLNLAHTRRIYKEVADRAEQESWSYRDFLALLLAEEVVRRKQTRLQRCTRSAHFPFFKTIDEFDFTLQSTLRESVIGSYLGLDFVTEGRSLILHGKTSRGRPIWRWLSGIAPSRTASRRSHHRGGTDRGSLQRQQAGTSPGVVGNLHATLTCW